MDPGTWAEVLDGKFYAPEPKLTAIELEQAHFSRAMNYDGEGEEPPITVAFIPLAHRCERRFWREYLEGE